MADETFDEYLEGTARQCRSDPPQYLDALHPRPYRENPADAFIADDGGKRGRNA
jgi:hypothetical protein